MRLARPSSPLCAFTEGVLKPSVTISTPCSPSTRNVSGQRRSLQMHLAVLADDAARLVDQDRRVEMIALRCELGVAEAHGHGGQLRLLEERPRRRARHLALEPDVGVAAVGAIP